MSMTFCNSCDSIMTWGKCSNRCRGEPKAIEQIRAIREGRMSQYFYTLDEIVLPKCPDCPDYHYKFTPCANKPKPEKTKMPREAARFNEGKPRLSYFRRSFRKMVEGIAWVKTFGANKYAEDNWRSGGKPDTEYWDSMDRHIDHFLSGEVYDQDSGCHHLAHACWNLCALLELNYPDVPMRDVAIYEQRMAYWAEKKKEREANE